MLYVLLFDYCSPKTFFLYPFYASINTVWIVGSFCQQYFWSAYTAWYGIHIYLGVVTEGNLCTYFYLGIPRILEE